MSGERVVVAAAVVLREGLLLLTQRPPGGAFPLMWELPGGKLEPGETPEQALVRELREELGVDARPLAVLALHRHDYPDGPAVEIAFVGCTIDREPAAREGVHAIRWILPEDVDPAEVLAADRPFLARLAAGAVRRP